MGLVESLRGSWSQHHLLHQMTFLEDVGSAAAENVRSAALRRWINRNGEAALSWIGASIGRSLLLGSVSASREVSFNQQNRVDLRVDVGGVPAAFIEVKWASSPNLEQLVRYRCEIDKVNPNTPLLIVSPIKYEAAPHAKQLTNVHSVDWSTLIEHMDHESSGNATVEHDLYSTLVRWSDTCRVVRAAVSESTTDIGELTELNEWLEASSVSLELNAPPEYAAMTRLAVVAELADAFVDKMGATKWRRCNASFGAHGDVQSDACRTDAAFFTCEHFYDVGLAVVLRFHADPELSGLDVNVGTQISPYLQGKERDDWISADSPRWTAVQQHASRIRQEIHASLRAMNHVPKGSVDSQRWWTRASARRFEAGTKIADIARHAEDISGAIVDLQKRLAC